VATCNLRIVKLSRKGYQGEGQTSTQLGLIHNSVITCLLSSGSFIPLYPMGWLVYMVWSVLVGNWQNQIIIGYNVISALKLYFLRFGHMWSSSYIYIYIYIIKIIL